jgi:hypothetical protein
MWRQKHGYEKGGLVESFKSAAGAPLRWYLKHFKKHAFFRISSSLPLSVGGANLQTIPSMRVI